MELNRRNFLELGGALLGTAVLGEEVSTLAARKGSVAEAAEPTPVYEVYALKYSGP